MRSRLASITQFSDARPSMMQFFGSSGFVIVLSLLTHSSQLRCSEPVKRVDFDTEIIPILTKAGCNAGSCHGSAAGRGGFHLSLFGSDAAADYKAIALEFEGRRIHLAAPEKSLFLRKPGGIMDHGGDMRIESFSPEEELMLRWIREGAPRLEERKLEKLKLEPGRRLVRRLGTAFRLEAHAKFDDGSMRDVTRDTLWIASDPTALQIVNGEKGEVVALRRGVTTLIARYLSDVQSVQIIVPLKESRNTPRKSSHVVDRHVYEMQATLGINSAPPADRAAFLRRTSLRLTGSLPTPDQTRTFMANGDANRNSVLIDDLLASDSYVDYWSYQLSSWLRIRSLPNDKVVAEKFHAWVRERVRNDVDLSSMARDLINATGDSHLQGAAGFHRMTRNARDQAEFVSELFMGTQLRCANCHNHPLDHWSQDDYHGLAAIFAKIDRGRVVKLQTRGEVTHPVTGRPARPRLPGDRFLESDENPLKALGEWLGDGKRPYFAKSMVNRIWKLLMGRGLVEPVDDLRGTNPASHPALLTDLAEEFASSGFRLRPLIRRITTSEAFARGPRTAAQLPDDRFYSHSLSEPMPPEMLLDALSSVTGVWETYPGFPAKTSALRLPGPHVPSPALDLLGRCSRETSCGDASQANGLDVDLHLLNGTLINSKVVSPSGRLHKQLHAGMSNSAILESFYLLALSRSPDDEEIRYWTGKIPESGTARKEALEDFLWSLLVCDEFRNIP